MNLLYSLKKINLKKFDIFLQKIHISARVKPCYKKGTKIALS